MRKIGLGTLHDRFVLSGEYQVFLGIEERLRSAGNICIGFGPNGRTMRLISKPVAAGEFVCRAWLDIIQFIKAARTIANEVDALHLLIPSSDFLWIADNIQRTTAKSVTVRCLGERPGKISWSLLKASVARWRFYAPRWLVSNVFPRSLYPAKRYFVGNGYVAQQLIDDGCPLGKVCILLPLPAAEGAADHESLRLAEEMRKAPTFVYVGHFLPNKGVEFAVRAFASLQRKDARLLLVWSRLGSKSKLNALIRRLGLHQRIAITDKVVHRQTVLRSARAALLPFESSFGQLSPPLVAVEAFKAGCPVLITRSPALHEMGKHCKSLFLLDSQDLEAWHDCMVSLLDTPTLVNEIRQQQQDAYRRWENESIIETQL